MAKEKTAHEIAMDALRSALVKAQAKMPGTPSVYLDLSKIAVFDKEDGDLCAVIPMREIIYLADTILRSNSDK